MDTNKREVTIKGYTIKKQEVQYREPENPYIWEYVAHYLRHHRNETKTRGLKFCVCVCVQCVLHRRLELLALPHTIIIIIILLTCPLICIHFHSVAYYRKGGSSTYFKIYLLYSEGCVMIIIKVDCSLSHMRICKNRRHYSRINICIFIR